MATHELKTLAAYWLAVERGEKLFEVRKNDRFFQAGDTVKLLKLTENGLYVETDGFGYGAKQKALTFRIGPILQGGQFGIEPGYCVFSLLPLEPESI